jgi:hypothetical protein
MRRVLLLLAIAGVARAQGLPPSTQPEPAEEPMPSQPPSAPPTPYTPPPPPPSDNYNPPPNQSGQSSISTVTPGYQPSATLTPPSLTPNRVVVSPQMQARWHNARVLYGLGSVTGLIGSGLTISSVLVTVITGYPCNPNDPIHMINPNDQCNQKGMMYTPPKPTDAVPLLGYMGASISALGFVFSAAGLGQQHHLLRELGADIPRGPFYAGNVLGMMGWTSVGLGYFFGFTSYLNPHDQGVAILACTVTSAAFSALGNLLFAIDASRTKKAWLHLGTF